MEHELIALDICAADYFNGCSYPYMAVPVFQDTTKEELVEEITREYNELYEHLVQSPGSPWPDLEEHEIQALAEDFIHSDMPFSNNKYLSKKEEAGEEYEVYLHIGIQEC